MEQALVNSVPSVIGVVVVVAYFLNSQAKRDQLYAESQATRDQMYVKAMNELTSQINSLEVMVVSHNEQSKAMHTAIEKRLKTKPRMRTVKQ